jgi:hypothetical protein
MLAQDLRALLLTMLCALAANAQSTVTKASPFTVIETTHLRNAQLGPLLVRVEAQLNESGQAFSARAAIWQAGRLLQRIDIESDTRTYERGRDVVVPTDIDRDGNADFWVIAEESKNSVWVLYRFNPRGAVFVRDGEWINPKIDIEHRCLLARTSAGHAGALGVLTIRCFENNQWVKRFERDQTKTRKHVPTSDNCDEDYLVTQTDWSLEPPKVTRFVLPCGDAMTKRLPPWVAQMYARSKRPSRPSRKASPASPTTLIE